MSLEKETAEYAAKTPRAENGERSKQHQPCGGNLRNGGYDRSIVRIT